MARFSARKQRRLRSDRRQRRSALYLSLALHVGLLAMVVGSALLGQQRLPLEFVSVQMVPLQALGTRQPEPAPEERQPPREPEPIPEPELTPPEPEPEPEPPEPEPEPEVNEEPEPEPNTPEPEANSEPELPAVPAADAGAERSATPRGSPEGNPAGTATFGSTRATVDNPDFTYDYYLQQMLAMIASYWRPPVSGGQIEAIVFFRIARDGSVSEVQILESSGHSGFDLAGLRAVQSASPLPPLPAGFHHESLGVRLILR